MSVESLTREITTIDDFGFEFRPWHHWLPESIKDELKRLELNQWVYRENIKLGQRFPRKCNQSRLAEYRRIREIRERL